MSLNNPPNQTSFQSVLSREKLTEKLIYLVAGESSGDILGAGLIDSLKAYYPNATFKGIGGPLMEKNGLESVYPYERLSVMGLIPILARFFELWRMRERLKSQIVKEKADCFIGIDAPVFNTELEYQLTRVGITSIHYVSPSVWAWRENRIHKIVKSVSLMLCLFPFELDIYKKNGLAAVAVGHPLADDIPLFAKHLPAQSSVRNALGIDLHSKIIAVLPGSRISETQFLLEPFIATARMLHSDYPQLSFIIPCATGKIKSQISAYLVEHSSNLPIKLVDGQAREVMLASDLVLLASGTATLEAMLLKKPMVVAYKLSKFSYFIYSRLLKIRNVSLPNLLSGKTLVKEFIQKECTAENLSRAVTDILDSDNDENSLLDEFTQIHRQLKLGGSEKAAEAVYSLLSEQNKK